MNASALQLRARAELELRRRGVDRSGAYRAPFREYVDKVFPGFRWYRHAEVMAEKLQAVADGELQRLAIFMPPRMGKSEEVSRLFPGYFLRRHPTRFVGLASYGQPLADTLSRHARRYYRESGGTLAGDASAVRFWQTSKGGGMWAAGVGGPITGLGAHLGLIDDPHKNRAEADSAVIRQGVIDWYRSTFFTRLEPGAPLVLTLTRWHESDLAGWIMANEEETQDGWDVLHFEQRKTDDKPSYPESCRVEPDWRDEGDVLCPERYNPEDVARIEATLGPREFASLHQQRPRPREGNLFKYSWFEDRFVDAVPETARRVRYWDLAGTDGDGDYTAGCRMSEAGGLYYVEDMVRGRWSPGRRDGNVVTAAQGDGRGAHQWIEQEAGINGKKRTQDLIGKLSGFVARAEPATGSKELRAEPFAAQCEVGNVRIVRGAWNQAFIEELCNFGPGCEHDDQVDAASGAFSKLSDRRSAKVVRSPWS